MKITSIKQQIKTAGRYSVFVEGEYSFSLSESVLIQTQITSGQELDTRQVEDYKKLSADDKLYNKVLRYVAMRQRSVWETEFYMQRKEAAPGFIEQSIEKLKAIGLLDDYKFAETFVRDRRLLRATSRRKLQAELRKKRVANDAIEAALRDDESDDRTALTTLIERKRRQSKYQDDTKLMQYLARQGFSYDDIKSALSVDNDS